MATTYAMYSSMLRYLIISTALIASSAAGAVALSVMHTTAHDTGAYDTDVARLTTPQKTGGFVIPAFAPSRTTTDVTPVALDSAVTPAAVQLPQLVEDELILTPVSTGPASSQIDPPRDSAATPVARPLPTVISVPTTVGAEVAQRPAARVAQAKPRAQTTQRFVAQTRIVSQAPRSVVQPTTRVTAVAPEYVIGVYR